MMHKLRTPFLIALGLLALGMILPACSGQSVAPTPSGVSAEEVQRILAQELAARSTATSEAQEFEVPFIIGVMDDLTGAGRTYGNVAIQAKLLAVAEINSAGGIKGRPLKLRIEDEKCIAPIL